MIIILKNYISTPKKYSLKLVGKPKTWTSNAFTIIIIVIIINIVTIIKNVFYYYHHFVIFILKIKAFGKCLYFFKFNLCQVTLFFHGKLYRGNRALKVDARRFGAFDSPNCPPLATVEAGIEGRGQCCSSSG